MPKLIDIDMDKLVEMGQAQIPQKTMAAELGISIPTLAKLISSITEKRGILMKYRELQSLQLTAIQARILEHITPEKIAEANLKDLILAYKILKDKEQVMEGKPSEIKGLVGYLIELEKRESAGMKEEFTDAEIAEAEAMGTEVSETFEPTNVENPDFLPKLN